MSEPMATIRRSDLYRTEFSLCRTHHAALIGQSTHCSGWSLDPDLADCTPTPMFIRVGETGIVTCGPCSSFDDKAIAIAELGWANTPICEWHQTHSWTLRASDSGRDDR